MGLRAQNHIVISLKKIHFGSHLDYIINCTQAEINCKKISATPQLAWDFSPG